MGPITARTARLGAGASISFVLRSQSLVHYQWALRGLSRALITRLIDQTLVAKPDQQLSNIRAHSCSTIDWFSQVCPVPTN